MSQDQTDARRPWSREEVEIIVADYLHMLMQEMTGQAYNKSAHRRALQQRLDDRSEGSIEFKYQNLSAVMLDLGCFYVSGYKRRSNYQQLLYDIAAQRIAQDASFDRVATDAAERPAVMPRTPDFSSMEQASPASAVAERAAPEYRIREHGIHRDYLAREARNRSLGAAGELLVVEYERYRLRRAGLTGLAERIEHVSQTRGDGLGYDVRSFDSTGEERFIEVKTTAFGRETPFYVSRNERQLAEVAPRQFQLYRLFDFRKAPRLFVLPGAIETHCRLDPVSYLARFG